MKTLICLMFFLNLTSISSQEKKAALSDLALQYMDAYSNWDYERMKSFYTDSIHFSDPTATEHFGPGYNIIGKEKAADFFKNIFQNKQPKFLSFKIKEYFDSKSYVVINSTFKLVLPKGWYGDETGKIFVSVPMITILRFKKEKIISHFDYVDYDEYLKQIQMQIDPND